MHRMSKVYIIVQRESNADEALLVNTEENINTNEEGILPLQITSEFMQYIPVRC
jgi:hypothetical protein